MYCCFVLYRYIRNLRRGASCCSDGQEPEKRIRVKDRNKENYPYTAKLQIDGMTCSKCALRVENAINALPGYWAMVNLGAKSAALRSKTPLDEDLLRKVVRESGYTVLTINQERTSL